MNGIYNINSGQLNINNNVFNRIIINEDGQKQYQINIISDNAKWFKDSNSLEFTSNDKQVETTVNLLTVKKIN